MKRIIRIFMILVLGMFSAQAQLRLDLQILNPDAQSFYVGDLDFIQKNSDKVIFSFTVQNQGEAVTGRFIFLVRYISGGEPVELIRGTTNEITIPTGVFWNMTNVDLNRGASLSLPGGGEVNLEITDYSINFERLDFINKYVMKTGKLPAGRYLFDVYFNEVQDVNPFNNQLVISNPSYVQLGYPGVDISTPDPMVIHTIAPVFQWFSDASLFDLYIYEVRPSDYTPSDIFGHEPYAVIRNITGQNFQYPIIPGSRYVAGINPEENSASLEEFGIQENIRTLQEGKTYAWYVEAKIITAAVSRTDIIRSPVFHFRIVDGNQDVMEEDMIIQALQMILGESYDTVMNQLKGYKAEGKILFNGKLISAKELLEIALKAQKEGWTVTMVEVE